MARLVGFVPALDRLEVREINDRHLPQDERRDGPVFLDSGLSGGCFDDG